MLYDINKYNKRRYMNEGFWDDFTNRDVMEDYHVKNSPGKPAVNVLQKENEYELQLIAPGLCRENYSINVHDDIMDITAQVPESTEGNQTYQRQEYRAGNFERSFIIPKNIRHEAISASCSDGILSIHLPVKDKENVEKRRSIEIN